MATVITSECINCGACEPECPNTAIYQGGVEWQAPDGSMHPPLSNDIFFIVPEKCTECVGFHDHEACAAVCPVDCCVPDPNIPETHEVLLERARALHPELTIADDAPSRFKKEGAAAPAAGAPPAAAAAPAPKPAAPASVAPKAAAPAAVAPSSPPVAAPAEAQGLAIPAPAEWDIPISCFRCAGEYTVPFAYFRAGVVFYCPHCQGSFVPTLSMVRGVEESLARFHARWTRAFEEFQERRRRELEQFETRQRRELEEFERELHAIATRDKPPGAPTKRRGFFTF